MKAVDFSAQLKQAGIALWMQGGKDPHVVVEWPGQDCSASVVKVTSRIGPDGPEIVIEI